MALRVVVVDDSGFFRRRIVEILSADIGIDVVGTAANGQEAIEVVKRLNPDVVTMDIEMPVMDGITAVRRIMAESPRPILMFSTLTTEGAKATLDALDAGAMDFLPKRFSDMAKDEDSAKILLRRRVRALGRTRTQRPVPAPHVERSPGIEAKAPPRPAPQAVALAPKSALPARSLRAVLIGTSTGGPVALQEVLKVLPKEFPLPIVLIQHMPASFTPAFAERLNGLCRIEVKEARDGDELKPGWAYLAPGGQQLVLSGGAQTRIRIEGSPPGTIYKPSVDITFSSAVGALRSQVLAVVLTGMGADGRDGARALKAQGAHVWAQDAASCVVFGMPAAVIEAGIADHVFALKEVGPALVKELC
ncbi:chemotaxis response regulator protein-glutamate methylesterase [Thiorhodococcus mannitoliphagus]|uniref:Protein-glutamate methylesterase/protein-glutamine glutaminase n=1 Tax=Thiorhodococcus mannitoliphagus TaxID=329406 RepID=A0A6P1DTX0_9GAMM|nr:chemotaxis response regulator protein-glutamate methylesterase [Thiorhodococcus mannitoliphagus]NEX20136.1 chemotaxis response regulator protein-glutamate methylesterase [Thiorhodococcus mannitoliphagus]